MTQKEYELKCENEKLKKQIKQKDLKISDLESQKKTLFNKLKIQTQKSEDLKKENKTEENKVLQRKNEILRDELKIVKKKLIEKDLVILNLSTRLKKDSTNSSKPSSTDSIYTKKTHIVNSRKKGGKTGGQWNHKGTTFSKDEVENLIKNKKENGIKHIVKNVGNMNGEKYKSKYEVDIEIVTTITEYRFYEDEKGKYNIPKKYEPEVQYGVMAKSLMIYFTTEMMSPLNKTRSFFKQVTNNIMKVSEGTIVNTQKVLDNKLIPVVEEIKKRLIEAGVLHVDETGVSVNGELNWLHTSCTKDLVYYEIHKKRGKEAIDSIGILAYFVNILVHDHWKSYYKEEHITHAECNSHILRYLKSILEITKSKKVEDFLELLVDMNETKKKSIKEGFNAFDKEAISAFSTRYSETLSKWKIDLNLRISKVKITDMFTDEINLLNRLEEYKEEHILFIKNFEVPFDNNIAERSLRMIKTKLKVSGGFRTEEGAKTFAKIRSFIQTMKYREENIIEQIKGTFEGKEYQFN